MPTNHANVEHLRYEVGGVTAAVIELLEGHDFVEELVLVVILVELDDEVAVGIYFVDCFEDE